MAAAAAAADDDDATLDVAAAEPLWELAVVILLLSVVAVVVFVEAVAAGVVVVPDDVDDVRSGAGGVGFLAADVAYIRISEAAATVHVCCTLFSCCLRLHEQVVSIFVVTACVCVC